MLRLCARLDPAGPRLQRFQVNGIGLGAKCVPVAASPSFQVSPVASDFVLREITAVLARKIERERSREKREREKGTKRSTSSPRIYVCRVFCCASVAFLDTAW